MFGIKAFRVNFTSQYEVKEVTVTEDCYVTIMESTGGYGSHIAIGGEELLNAATDTDKIMNSFMLPTTASLNGALTYYTVKLFVKAGERIGLLNLNGGGYVCQVLIESVPKGVSITVN